MNSNYIFGVTEEDAFHEFCNMPDDLLAIEIVGMKDVLNSLSELDSRLLNSYSFDCTANLLDIAQDALTLRFVHSHMPFDSEDGEKDIS